MRAGLSSLPLLTQPDALMFMKAAPSKSTVSSGIKTRRFRVDFLYKKTSSIITAKKQDTIISSMLTSSLRPDVEVCVIPYINTPNFA